MIISYKIGNTLYSGNGKISGNAIVDGAVRMGLMVLLFEGNICIRSTFTDATGQYEFNHLDTSLKYDVLMKDPRGIWESKVSSRRTPLV